MRPFSISRSLYRPVTWMGMERIPGALWLLTFGILGLTGIIYAKAYISSLILVAICVAGTVCLRKLAEYDPAFFKVLIQRKNYQDSYPAYTRRKGRRNV
jgi:type IV secretory pathway TrbD component